MSNQNDDDDISYKGAVVGGGLGFALGGPVGAAAGAAITHWLENQDADGADELTLHNRALLRAAREVNIIADERGGPSASLYVAHIDGDDYELETEDGGTGGVLDSIDGEPDLIYSDVGGPTGNMIVEAETTKGFGSGQRDHTLDQLERYRLPGYKLVIAVPADEVQAAQEFVEEHDVAEPNYVVAAENIASLL